MDFLGNCGRSKRPCKLAWSSLFGSKLGSYPADLLPSKSTIWYMSVGASYSFGNTSLAPGESFGLPLAGAIIGSGIFTIQSLNLSPVSSIVLTFAKTRTHINNSYKITQSDLDQAVTNNGIITIDVGQYIFEFIGVTDQRIQELTEDQLTPAELQEIEDSKDTVSDYLFRKIFKDGIKDQKNRLVAVVANYDGIAYRLDNGSSLSENIFGTGGFGDINSPDYRDGTSRKITIDISTPKEEGKPWKVGDEIFLHYGGITKHYFRQVVKVKWSVVARYASGLLECYPWPIQVQAVNYKFFSWNIDTIEDGKPATQKLWGWRAVEAFNVPTWLARGNGSRKLNVSPQYESGNITTPISNTTTKPVSNNGYTAGPGVGNDEDKDAWEHVYFNVHPLALKKPDTLKIAMEQSLAEDVQSRLSDTTLRFPFFDDTHNSPRIIYDWSKDGDPSTKTINNTASALIDPTSYSYCNSSNFKLDPLKNSSKWSLGNAEVSCGISGGVVLGNSPDDVTVSYAISSPVIQETMDEDTHIIVERCFTYGQRGASLISIEATGLSPSSISCIQDPMGERVTEIHTNKESYMVYNLFDNSMLRSYMNVTKYRDDLPAPVTSDVTDPISSDYEPTLGFSGMLADRPGYTDGRIVSSASVIRSSDIEYYISDMSLEKRIAAQNTTPNIVNISTVNNVTSVDLRDGYYGATYLYYNYKNPDKLIWNKNIDYIDNMASKELVKDEFLLRFKDSGSLEGVVDSLYFYSYDGSPPEHPFQHLIDHQWMKCNSIEVVGNAVNEIPMQIMCLRIKDELAHDFLEEEYDSNIDDKPSPDKPIVNNRGVFFKTRQLTISEDDKSNVYAFFVDQRGNISAARSGNFGNTWHYCFAVVPRIKNDADGLDYKCAYPFAVTSFKKNCCFLFYTLDGKLLCKTIQFDQFEFPDMMIVKNDSLDLFGLKGQQMRRSPSWLVAGNVYKDNAPKPENIIDKDFDKLLTLKEGNSNKYPIRLSGPYRTNEDITGFEFSAYMDNTGYLKVFYPRVREGLAYLCWKLSNNDGQNWISAQENEDIEGVAVNKDKSSNSVYLFYKSSVDQVYVFYIYNQALMCKIVQNSFFGDKSTKSDFEVPAYFVDGLLDDEMKAQISEQKSSGPTGWETIDIYGPMNYSAENTRIADNFNTNRAVIPNQRICAHETPNGHVRVFYKNTSNQLRSAMNVGGIWYVEDFMRYYKS